MPKDNSIFIDTSVWIDYFNQKDSHLEQTVDLLLDQARIATSSIILAELIQGARSAREIDSLQSYFEPLTWIPSTDQHWLQAGRLSFELKKTGKTVNLTDCYIAAIAQSRDCQIYTLDKHFTWIAEITGVVLLR